MARRSRRQEEVQDSLAEDAGFASTPDGEAAPQSASKRAAAKARHVSLKQLAELLDRDRGTIEKWVAKGCPYVSKGDRDAGQAWVFDLAEVVKWRERDVAETAVEKLGSGKPDEESLKLRRMSASVSIIENDAAEAVQLVARVSSQLELMRRDYSEITGVLRGLPKAIAAKVDSRYAAKAQTIAEEQVHTALSALRADKDLESFLKDG
jgi:terminase small subunit / prophage DNA-packing protein